MDIANARPINTMNKKLISQDLLLTVLRNAEHEAVRQDASEDAFLLNGLCSIIKDMEAESPIDCLNRLRDKAYSDAVAHGLWEMAGGALAYLTAARLILAEAHELYEAAFRLDTAYRMYHAEVPDHEAIAHAWKCYCEELADVMIMSLSSCGEMNIDADGIVAQKMDINHGRSWQHKEDKRNERERNLQPET